MEVNPGYKQTEVGVIPEDWEIVQLSAVSAFITKGSTPTTYGFAWQRSGVLFLRSECVSKEGLDLTQSMYISADAHRMLRRSAVRSNDLLITITGNVGRVVRLPNDFGEANINQHIARIQIYDDQVQPDWVYHFLSQPIVRHQFEKMTTGQAYPQISLVQVRNAIVPRPPLPEQRAIASALSDLDALLGRLDKLIAKKRDLKQAAMQELLTGKRRLPGFDGKWEVKTLGELGDVSGSGVDKKTHANEQPVRLLNYMDVYLRQFIYSSELEHWVTASSDKVRKCAIQRGDVFFTPSSETRDDIGLSAVAMEDIPDACYSYHIVRFRLREPWDLRFRAYAFQTRGFLSQAEILCDGGGTRYVVSLGKFRSMTVQVPPLQEQAAIGQVLSDMDAEIDALEQRRKKTKDIKQAMMQELLTGKTRLL